MYGFKWADPTETNNAPREENNFIDNSRRIAAVNMDTFEMEHIFQNVIVAAESILKLEYSDIECDRDTIQYAAKKIAEATREFHKECLGYYWKLL